MGRWQPLRISIRQYLKIKADRFLRGKSGDENYLMFGALSHGCSLAARGRDQPGYRLLPSVHGTGPPSPLQGYYDPRGSDQRETHIPLQSSPSRVGSQLSEGSSTHTMPPWHWILEGPPQGCLTFCSPPPPATHMPGQLRPSLVGSHLSCGSSTHDIPSGAFDDAGSAAG